MGEYNNSTLQLTVHHNASKSKDFLNPPSAIVLCLAQYLQGRELITNLYIPYMLQCQTMCAIRYILIL